MLNYRLLLIMMMKFIMEINDYQNAAARTLADLNNPLLNDLHMVVGMVTESAEIADAYKKHFAYGKELDLVNVKEEIGDLMWYVANFCNMYNWDLRAIIAKNITKLQARYPEKFTQEQALNRDLNNERNILEQ